MGAKEEINRIAEYFKSDEDFDVNFFESEDALEFMIATASPDEIIGGDGEETPSSEKKPEGPEGPDEGSPSEEPEDEPKINGEEEEEEDDEEGKKGKKGKGKKKKKGKDEDGDEGEEDEGEDEEEEGEDDDDDRKKKKKKKNKKKERKLKVGDKVFVKTKQKIGKITAINPNGTYEVGDVAISDLEQSYKVFQEYDDGGDIIDGQMVGEEPIGGASGTYQEDELELFNTPDEDEPEPDEQDDEEDDEEGDEEDEKDEDEDGVDNVPKPKKVDTDELIQKLERIKKIRYKLPAFIFSFFGFDVTKIAGKHFLQFVCKLALLNRIAKDVLKYKSTINDEKAKFMLEDIRSTFYSHIEFLYNATEKYGDIYRLKTPSAYFLSQWGNENIIDELINILKDWQNQGITQIIEEQDLLVLNTIKKLISNLEKTEVTDNQYYRMLSLSAIYNPELFSSENYLKTHIDFVTNYFNTDSIPISNIYNPCYTGIVITEELLFTKMGDKNLNIYNVIKIKDEYIIYCCENIRLAPDKLDKLYIFKKNISDIYYGVIYDNKTIELQMAIWSGLQYFYDYCVELRNSEISRQISFDNLNKLSKLQVESYKSYLSDLKLQTTRYGL